MEDNDGAAARKWSNSKQFDWWLEVPRTPVWSLLSQSIIVSTALRA